MVPGLVSLLDDYPVHNRNENIGATFLGKWSFVLKTAFSKRCGFRKGVVLKRHGFQKGTVFKKAWFSKRHGFKKGAVFKWCSFCGFKTTFFFKTVLFADLKPWFSKTTLFADLKPHFWIKTTVLGLI